MVLPKIICFSGRKRSGKTELSKICTNYGYNIINFADNLKKMVCNCLDITLNDLEKYKDQNMSWNISKKTFYISKELGIDEMIIKNRCQSNFKSIREILQVLGTDIIRKYNPEWHVNKTVSYIQKNETRLFCIGDCRFLNEKKIIEKLGGECWFIIRPEMMEISNHPSEIELNWTFFNKNRIIINDVEKDILIKRWDNYLYKRNLGINIYPFKNNYLENSTFLYTNSEISYLAGFFKGCNILIENNKLNIQHLKLSQIKHLKELDIKGIVYNKDNVDIYNSYVIENLKLWNIFTDKDEVPVIIKMNNQYLKEWIIGLIDSSGKVDLINDKVIIEIFCSKNILQYICEHCNIIYEPCEDNKWRIIASKYFMDWLGETTKMGLIQNWNKN